MRVIGAVVIVILCVALYLGVLKLSFWWIDREEKDDNKWFGGDMDDYKVEKKKAAIKITGLFVLLIIALLYLYLSRW